MLALALLLPLPGNPLVPGAAMPADAQWALLEASPRVSVAGRDVGTGVVIGVRDGFAYVLTAEHVVPYDGVVVRFTTRDKYPAADWYPDAPEVVARWKQPDLALVRFRTGGRAVPTKPLAAAGGRPRPADLPAAGYAVGHGGGKDATVWADEVRAKRAARRPGGGLAFMWETARPPVPGRSGGPLADAAGRVIGVCAASESGLGYYTHLDEIHAALKRDGYGWLIPNGP